MPFKAARPAGRRRGSRDDSPASGSRILEEAPARLAAQAAGIDHLAQQRRRPVFGIAEAVVQHFSRGTLYGMTAACLAVCLAYTACGDGLYPYFAAVWLVGLAALAWRYRRLAGRLKTRNNR